ncbi:hypothetical protein CWB58_09835 [Pseudoalteromonas sp. S201]|uniref:hypothetical protein n=1 Tax=Pseudoalteromonas sp. S201 TaxID=579519 RepID=UPI00110CBBB6|nr:hypothetical protein [Pseudoalteromonas sp. S201]TMS93317.1 hypothetical protein CWB58_09835 [Pseudoalteromonas sp. S201]
MTASLDIDTFQRPTSIVSVSSSKNEVLVDVGQKELRKVTIPKESELSLQLVIIQYLNSVKFKKLEVNTRGNFVRFIDIFLSFLESQNYSKNTDVPNKVFHEYIQFVNDNTNRTGNSVAATISAAKIPLEWYLESAKDKNSHIVKQFTKLLAYAPKLQYSEQNPTPSLAKLFPECPYTDTQIIKSLRLVCCWLLLEYNRHREILLSDHEIQSVLADLEGKSLDERPVAYGSFTTKNTPEINEECKTLYAPIVNAVLKSRDNVLMERLVESINHPFSLPLAEDELKLILKKVVTLTGEKVISGCFKYKGKAYPVSSIQTVSYRDLIAPSLVEVFATQTFLASERLQASNLDRLKVSDIVGNERGIQSQHVKGRRSKGKQKGLTGVYPPNHLIHDSLINYINVLNKCQARLHDKDKDKALPYIHSQHIKNGALGLKKEPVSQCFELLTIEGSHTQQSLFEDVTKKDAEPFIWIVRKIIENNKTVNEQDKEYARERHKSKSKGEPIKPRSYFVKSNSISLSASYIGVSRVVMEGNVSVKERKDNTSDTVIDNSVSSQLTNHNESTKHNTYFDRSNAKEIITSSRKFAVQVGDLMLADAEKMGQLMKDTTVVDLDEAKKILGCQSASENFKSFVDEMKLELGITSEIKSKDKTIFVANELTAALIILKIEHIEKQLPRLLDDQLESDSKAMKAIEEKVYLQTVFDRFPESIQSEGKALSKNLTFTFSDLI